LCCLVEILSASACCLDAQALGIFAYKAMVETLGAAREETLRCKNNIAVATSQFGDKSGAVRMLQYVLRARITINGKKKSWLTFETGYELSISLARLDRHWKAEMYLVWDGSS